jgi:hypothetical protein
VSNNRIRWSIASVLLFLCLVASVGIVRIAQRGSEGQAPIRSLRITLDESQRELLFAQLRQFAKKHGFEIQIDEVRTPSGKHFNVWMSRDDILIISSDRPKAQPSISVSFYNQDPAHPASTEMIEGLLDDIKIWIQEIPNVEITEQQ